MDRDKTVAIAGSAPLAEELATAAAAAGYPVRLYLLQPTRDPLPAGVTLVDSPEAATRGATIAMEAVAWPRDQRRQVVAALDSALGAGGLLLVSGWCSSVTESASWTARPERVVGFTGISPLAECRLFEVAPALQTADQPLAEAQGFLTSLGKEVAVVKDMSGLVLPRILALIINEAASTYMEGMATREDIDTAMRLGTNYPHGPLEWADIIGLDLVYGALAGLMEELGDDRYRPCPLIRKLVLAGWLGRKSGRGFYTYN